MSEEQAKAIKARRLALGIPSINAAADLSVQLGKKVPRASITNAENGTASSGIYDRLNALYDAFEYETGHGDPAPAAPAQVTFSLRGVHGKTFNVDEFVASGPVENLAEIEAAVARILSGAEVAGGTD